jgi:hypothetical protein
VTTLFNYKAGTIFILPRYDDYDRYLWLYRIDERRGLWEEKRIYPERLDWLVETFKIWVEHQERGIAD